MWRPTWEEMNSGWTCRPPTRSRKSYSTNSVLLQTYYHVLININKIPVQWVDLNVPLENCSDRVQGIRQKLPNWPRRSAFTLWRRFTVKRSVQIIVQVWCFLTSSLSIIHHAQTLWPWIPGTAWNYVNILPNLPKIVTEELHFAHLMNIKYFPSVRTH